MQPRRRTTLVTMMAGIAVCVATCFATPARADTPPSVIDTIPVGTNPYSVAVTPDGKTALVANRDSDDVSVIDLATATVTKVIPVGTSPRTVVVAPDGATAYVANFGLFGFGGSSLSVIDLATLTVTRVLTLADGWDNYTTDLFVSPDSRYLYGKSTPVQSIDRFDTTAGFAPTRYWEGMSMLSYTALSPNGSTIATSLYIVNKLAIVDTATMTETWLLTLPDGVADSAFSPDGTHIYVGSGNNIKVISAATGLVERTIPLGRAAGKSVISPDGATLYVTSGTGTVSVVDFASDTVTGVTVGASDQLPAITPDGEWFTVVDPGANHLIVIATATLAQTTLTVGTNPFATAMAPGSRQAIVTNRDSNNVTRVFLPAQPARGSGVPRAPLQQFALPASGRCVDAPAFVDLPGLPARDRALGWSLSWAQWPNGGTGGPVCTRQPFYTSSGFWSAT